MVYIFVNSLKLLCIAVSLGVGFEIRYDFFNYADSSCRTTISVYNKNPSASRLQCAALCIADVDRACYKAIWDSKNKMCMLHAQMADYGSSETVDVLSGWQVYRTISRGELYEKLGLPLLTENQFIYKV